MKWDDSDIANRFALFDNQLAVYKPDPPSKEPYFTRLADLKPPPRGPVLNDFPPFTRLIARGPVLYDVFARRTRPFPVFKGAPIGARLATQMSSTLEDLKPATLYANPYGAPHPHGTIGGLDNLGVSLGAILRCCGHDKGVELFNVVQYVSVSFDFPSTIDPALLSTHPLLVGAVPFPSPPSDATTVVPACLLNIGKRWNSGDNINGAPATFEIGAPVTARGRYHALLLRGPRSARKNAVAPEIRINILKEVRAFMGETEGFCKKDDLAPDDDGSFILAHEFGHVFSHPDEYLNHDFEPSLKQPNISESQRSAGTPYGFDDDALMNHNIRMRTRYFWDLLLFARAQKHFGDAASLTVKRGNRTFTADITEPEKSRVRFPVFQKTDVAVSTVGLCDLFVYLTGRDEFTAEEMDPSAKASPYDGFVVVRVKMAWDVTVTNDYDDLIKFMSRAADSIHDKFNSPMRVALRATVGGRNVRLRLLFAPRFICSTFPHDPNKGDQAKYLKGIFPALPQPFQASDHTKRVNDIIRDNRVHVNVRLGSGTPGVKGPGSPRQAHVRNDGSFLLVFSDSRFDEDTVAMFGQMVGSANGGAPRNAADLKPLADALVATFSADISAALPELVKA